MATSTRKKFTLEYPMKAGPELLFGYLSTPIGLAGWFADDVNVKGDIYTFVWEGSEERVKLLARRHNKHVKFAWIDRPGHEFVLFEIIVDALTGDVALVITDFDEEEEHERDALIYKSSLERLKSIVGG